MLARHTLLVISIAVVTFFAFLGSSKLWDRDEPRNARCAWEMLERGDWIVPTFNDELRTHKPILLYWLTMMSYSVFGVSEFGARFPSAALAVATVLLTYLIGRRLFNAQAALWAAIVLTSTLMFNVAARAATPDSTLIFCGTLALWIYVNSIPRRHWDADSATCDSSPDRPTSADFDIHSITTAICMFAAMGLGVLAKGPVGLVLPTAVVGMFLLIVRLPMHRSNEQRQSITNRMVHLIRPFSPKHFLATCWKMRPMTAILAAGIVSVPWYYLVGIRTDGEWLRGFFFDHNVGRAMSPMEGHNGSILFYPAAILVGFFPWSVLTIPVALWARGSLKKSQSFYPLIFLLCWIGVYVGTFSLAQTKLPSYVTPTYPALALLCGAYLNGCLLTMREEDPVPFWPQMSMLCLCIVGGVIAIALPIVAQLFLPGEAWLGVVGVIPLLGGTSGWLALRRRQHAFAACTLAATAVCLMITAFSLIAPRVSQYQHISRLLNQAGVPASRQDLATFAAHEPSWVYYAGQSIPFFRWHEQAQAIEFLTKESTGYLITTETKLNELRPHLPTSVTVIDSVPYFLEQEELVLLHRSPMVSRSDSELRVAR